LLATIHPQNFRQTPKNVLVKTAKITKYYNHS
jgi:hypothetical protein